MPARWMADGSLKMADYNAIFIRPLTVFTFYTKFYQPPSAIHQPPSYLNPNLAIQANASVGHWFKIGSVGAAPKP